MIRTQTWERGRIGDAALPPGWQMGPNGAPQFTGYAADLLTVRDDHGNTATIPQGINAANWEAAQNAVNAGTITIQQVAAQYGGTVQYAPSGVPAQAATFPAAVLARPTIPAPITPAPVILPAAPAAAAASGFSLSSIPSWGYMAAGIGLLFLFRK